MGNVAAILMILTAFGMIMGGFVWLASRVRRRGIGGSLLGALDEIYHPAAHRSHIEIQVQEERVAPMPSPSDL